MMMNIYTILMYREACISYFYLKENLGNCCLVLNGEGISLTAFVQRVSLANIHVLKIMYHDICLVKTDCNSCKTNSTGQRIIWVVDFLLFNDERDTSLKRLALARYMYLNNCQYLLYKNIYFNINLHCSAVLK